MSTSIAARSALVTGGGSGIGLGAAARLAADGAHVTICGRTAERLAAALERLTPEVGQGGSVRSIVADVTVEDQVRAAVALASEMTGALDILFANAGGSMHMGPLETADAGAVRATIDLNLMGTVLCIKQAVPAMRAGGGGSIIAMSSGAGAFPHRYLWAYGAAKAGIDMLCRSAAEELGADGIRVNTVQPGIVDDALDVAHHGRWPTARRLPRRDAAQPGRPGERHRRGRALPGRPGVLMDHRGEPAHRRRPPPPPRCRLLPAVQVGARQGPMMDSS